MGLLCIAMPCSTDAALAKDRLNCYRGIARVSLDSLNFRHSLVRKKHRDISQQNVLHLVEVFERKGCLRLQEEHVIDAVVRDEDLKEALARQEIPPEDFRNLQWAQNAPLLDISDVQCLSGMHRIEAAQRYLDDNDKWWIVRLFSYETPKTTLTRIIESYAHEQKPSDGEVFRKIRLYHRAGDSASEDRWWACLEKSKPKDLRQLLKRKVLVGAFDKLIDMPGLWTGIHIGALHRLLTLKCDEEMVMYLRYIARSWKAILRCNGRTLSPSAIDSQTAQKLEDLTPCHSKIDKVLVCDLMERGILFPSQSDPVVRKALLSNLCSFPGLIPSLRTFFGMLKYIEPTCEALRKLLDTRLKSTIRSSFMGLFWAPSQCSVQASEHEDIEVKTDLSNEDKFMIAYAELWAFCTRHFDGLTASTPLKEITASKPTSKGPNPVTWQHLARFATSKGFRIPNAQSLLEDGEECYRQLALEYLRKVHPTRSVFDSQEIQKVILDGQTSSASSSNDNSFLDAEYLSPERRNGRPFEDDFVKEKMVLFLPRLYSVEMASEVTLTYVRRELFSRLFCDLQHLEYGTSSGATMAHEAMDIWVDEDEHSNEGQANVEVKVLVDKNQKLEVEKDRLLQDLAGMQDAFTQLQRELANVHVTHAQLQKQLESSQGACAQIQQQFENSQDARAQIQQELANTQGTLTQLQSNYQQLQILAKGMLEDKERLQKECDKLESRVRRQRAQTPLSNSTHSEPTKPPPLQPLAIEATSVMMLNDETTEISPPSLLLPASTIETTNEPTLSKWEPGAGNYDDFELFIGAEIDSKGCLVGRSFLVAQEASMGTENVSKFVQQAKEHFVNRQLSALNPLGKRLPNLEPSYLFSAFSERQRTIFLAPEDVAERYIMSISYSVVESLEGAKSTVLTIANASIGRRRRLSEVDDEVQIRTSTLGEYEAIIARNEDPTKTKKRILKLKTRAPTPFPESTIEAPSGPAPASSSNNTALAPSESAPTPIPEDTAEVPSGSIPAPLPNNIAEAPPGSAPGRPRNNKTRRDLFAPISWGSSSSEL
ncbi:hypothetical protein T440DRAFT_126264 [Plenodomus tracheiphilus IPT5]|uniref:Uncharacterized protein n=1 Tax=Plenodomus tracheiphilus IPT5 TaxID=1408161 RepID=A0A6A7B519_9PLEO|nr:hypothetical protein T440DRAFT_126264 [Plenodomus tracheiphilus IPT5]